MENVYIAHGLDTYKRYLTCNRCISMEITLSQFVAVVQVSFVGMLLDRFININPSHELLRPLPHGQTRGWVIKEHPLVTRPHHTPDTYAQVNPKSQHPKALNILFIYLQIKTCLLNIVDLIWADQSNLCKQQLPTMVCQE